jgi:hypothetical protein
MQPLLLLDDFLFFVPQKMDHPNTKDRDGESRRAAFFVSSVPLLIGGLHSVNTPQAELERLNGALHQQWRVEAGAQLTARKKAPSPLCAKPLTTSTITPEWAQSSHHLE